MAMEHASCVWSTFHVLTEVQFPTGNSMKTIGAQARRALSSSRVLRMSPRSALGRTTDRVDASMVIMVRTVPFAMTTIFSTRAAFASRVLRVASGLAQASLLELRSH